MAYIGNTAASRFVSNRAASVFSGDGSAVAFTLEQVVTQDEDILVSVDGVVQEPSVAYAVSSGTTLTFTAAPSTNSGNNIFVYYLASQAGTVGHPSTQALSATNGTFTTGNVTIGSGAAADAKIVFDGNAQDFHIGLDDSSDALVIGKGSALGTTTSMFFDVNGIITKPLQPAFLAKPATAQNNLAVDTEVTVVLGTEIFDQNGDFASNVFTAPVTGSYRFDVSLRLGAIDSASGYYLARLSTSNRNHDMIFDSNEFSSDLDYFAFTFSVLTDMDGSDTTTLKIYQNSGTAQTDIDAGNTRLSGNLVC